MAAQELEQFTPQAKATLRVLTISLVIDLIAFACILPLFPSIMEHYRQREADKEGLLQTVLRWVGAMREAYKLDAHYDTVLFGGVLGSLFSLLQFVSAPLIGQASDRYGRRPMLVLTTFGVAISYALWLVSSSFELFVLSRVLGGLSKGNIHLSLAVVSDVTTPQTRNRGMMYVGIPFSVGFIVGPLVGALFAKTDLTQAFPWLATYGINSFSLPALFALGMCLANLLFLAVFMKETLPQGKGATASTHASPLELLNPIKLLGLHLEGQVRWLNLVYFLFLFAYSGLEFTLSFLVHERFNYTNMQQGKLLAFIGLITALVQGGYVRRKGQQERRLALQGMAVLIGGLLLIGCGHTPRTLYLGATLFAFTSGTVVTSLTSLASLYVDSGSQGYVVGILRASGALARALGPTAACAVYWTHGAAVAYAAGAAFIVLPLALTLIMVTQPAQKQQQNTKTKKEE
eukprot:comp23871_c1_seq1/m.41858 comp23871_c1_seq1/g.41858  ORF comp23871_c1_seq1/g.41858 comp23871_c1_seq1/m.41858 type:complete len:460 (-) comp23871_c1_seq1:513-1892(-)